MTKLPCDRLAVALVVALAAACGGTSTNTTPTATITSPTANTDVAMGTDANKSVPLVYAVTNFTLAQPGKGACGTDTATCGHLHLNIDGDACNAAGSPYNAASFSSPATLKFALCPSAAQAGPHTVTVTMHTDSHAPVNGGNNASLTFTTH
jgi:hypothetical protein